MVPVVDGCVGLGEHIGDSSPEVLDLSLPDVSFEDSEVAGLGVRDSELCLRWLVPIAVMLILVLFCGWRDCMWRCLCRLVKLPEGASIFSSENVSAPRALLGRGGIGVMDAGEVVFRVRTGMAVSVALSEESQGETGTECLSRRKVRNIWRKRWRLDFVSWSVNVAAVLSLSLSSFGAVVVVSGGAFLFALTVIMLCVRLIRRESDILVVYLKE